MKKDIVFICSKCKKRQEPNWEKSNENWRVFDNVPCECGGEFRLDFGNKEV